MEYFMVKKVNINFQKFSHDLEPEIKAGWILALDQIMLKDQGLARIGAITILDWHNKRVNKKSRKTKIETPTRLRTIYKLVWLTVSIGNDYETMVNNALIKAGQEPDFEAGSSYDQRVNGSRILYEHKTKEKTYYLRVYGVSNSFQSIVQHYDSDFKEISTDEFKQIKEEYLGKDRKSLVNPYNYGMDSLYVLNHGKHFDKIQNEDFMRLIELLKEKQSKKSA
jgi:hypothetical protein